METVGDLIGILMALCNSGIFQLSGERGKDNLLRFETVGIQFNPVLASYLELNCKAHGSQKTSSL